MTIQTNVNILNNKSIFGWFTMTEKVNVSYIQEKFLEKGLTPLFTTYENNVQKLPFRCYCGREDSTKWVHFSTAKDFGCWFCKHNIKGTEEEKINKLRYLLSQVKVKPVEPLIFPKGDSYFSVICECGGVFKTKINYLWVVKKGERYKCKECLSRDIAFDADAVKQKFLTKGAIPLFNDSDYKNRNSLLRFKCSCGKEDFVSMNKIRQMRNSIVCSECQSKRNHLSIEDVRQRFLEAGLIPLFDSYTSGKEYLPCKTKCCGEIKHISLANLPKKKSNFTGKCIKCQSNERRLPFSKIKDEFEGKRGLTILSTEQEYKSTSTILRLQCLCGKEIHRSYRDTVLTGSSGLCPECQFKLTRPRGKKHGRYNPNLTSLDRIRDATPYVTWANQTKKFHNNNCFILGKTDEKIVVHHLNGRHWNKLDRVYFLNAVPLSESLHKEFHSIYGYGNNTEAQFKEWIAAKNKSLDLIGMLKNSCFYVRRLLLFFDLKNICKKEEIQIANTEIPYLFLLKKGESIRYLYIMNVRNSSREHLISLLNNYPEMLILSSLEILDPNKRSILPNILNSYMSPEKEKLTLQTFEIKEISKEDNKTFTKSNSLLDYLSGSKGYGLFVNEELVASLSMIRKGNRNYLLNFIEKQDCFFEESFQKIFEYIVSIKKRKYFYFIQDRRFPLKKEINAFFHILKISRPKKHYSKNSLFVKKAEVFTKENIQSKVKKYDETLSIHENLVLNNYNRFYDAGTVISIWRRKHECS